MSGFSACRTGHLGYHCHSTRGGARLYRALGNSTLTLPHVITTLLRGGRAPRNVHVPGTLIPCYKFRVVSWWRLVACVRYRSRCCSRSSLSQRVLSYVRGSVLFCCFGLVAGRLACCCRCFARGFRNASYLYERSIFYG